MHKVIIPTFAALLLTIPAGAQMTRRAAIVGGGYANGGSCRVQVWVDGSAEIRISGDDATIRDISGRPPQWQNFTCTGVMPRNPASVSFRGLEGRGRQSLVSDPRRDGVAVVRIDDPMAGPDVYSFEISWSGQGSFNPGQGSFNPYGAERMAAPASAVDACSDQVRRGASDRFGVSDINIRNIESQNNSGRMSWITGTFFLPGDDTPHRFSCSVDNNSGRLRSVNIDQGRYSYSRGSANREEGYANREDMSGMAVQSCQSAVDNRLRDRGFGEIEFGSSYMPRMNQVNGTVRADRGRGDETYSYSCRVDPDDGDIRAVTINRR